MNPCPPKSKVIPGVNNYFQHLFPNKYIHCDFDGRAFVRNCASGTRWNQELYACSSSNTDVNEVTQATLIQQPVNNYAQPSVQPIQTVKPVLTKPIINQQIQTNPSGYSNTVQPVQIVNSQQSDYNPSQTNIQQIEQQTDGYGSSQTFIQPTEQQTDSYGSSQTFIQPTEQQTNSYGSSQTFIRPTEQQTNVESFRQTDNRGTINIDQPNQFVNTQSNSFESNQNVQPVFETNQNLIQPSSFSSSPNMIQPINSVMTQPNNFGQGQFFQPKLAQNSNTFGSGRALPSVQPAMFPRKNNFLLNQPPTSFQTTFSQSGGQVFKPLSAKNFVSNPFVPANVFNWYSTEEY